MRAKPNLLQSQIVIHAIDAEAIFGTAMSLMAKQGREGKALTWLTVAAEAGHLEAQFNLGILYTLGDVVPYDAQMAYYWIRQAAYGGMARAQYWLARCHMTGELAEQSFAEAYRWSVAASAQGFPDTGIIRAAAGERLSAAERREIDSAATAGTQA